MEERIERLERMLDRLCYALQRKGTEQDGNWGYMPFDYELHEMRAELASIIAQPNGAQ